MIRTDEAANFALLGRPQNSLYPAILCGTCSFICDSTASSVLLCILFFYVLYPIAATINNLTDVRTDALNHRLDNPIATRRISVLSARLFLIAYSIAFVILNLFMSQPWTMVISSAYTVLLYAYSCPPLRLQSRSFAGTIALSLCYSGLPIILGYVQSNQTIAASQIAIVALLMAVVSLPILLAKDYKDVVGDRRTGKHTPVVRYGTKTVQRVAIAVSITAAVAVLVFLFAHDSTPVICTLAILVSAVYLYAIKRLHQNKGAVSILAAQAQRLTLVSVAVLLLISIP